MLTSSPCPTWWASSWICHPASAGAPWSSPSSDSTGSASGRWEAPTTTLTPNSRCLSGLGVKVSSGRTSCTLFPLQSFPVRKGKLSVNSYQLKHLGVIFSSKDLKVIRLLCLHLDLYPVYAKLRRSSGGLCELRRAFVSQWRALSLVMR